MPPNATKRARGGFSLLEVLVALAVMSVSLTSILGMQSTAARATEQIRFMSIAPHLARTAMSELLIRMQRDGWGAFDKAETGDFSDIAQRPDFKWRAEVKKIEMELSAPSNAGSRSGANPMAGMIAGYVGVITQIMKQALREVTITVWEGDSGDTQPVYEYKLTTHVVDLREVRAPF